jgi:hypothetical protein
VTTVVFCGPTLSAGEASTILPAGVFLGPAAGGDVYRAAQRKPASILLIDGYFDHRLSVWHKEILWALTHGVRVYGASSMGALRAAELAAFGMVGVGRVFQLFECGDLEDDDEVAVVHDEAEQGYRLRSEAMVNIRVTLEQARRAGALSASAEQRLVQHAKSRFYPERSFTALLAAAPELGLTEPEVADFRGYLRTFGRVDQKRRDAVEALERARDDEQQGSRPEPPPFRFSYTNAWHVFRQKNDPSHAPSAKQDPAEVVTASSDPDPSPEAEGQEQLVAAPPEVAEHVWAEALERALALVLAVDDDEVGQDELQAESEKFRRVRNLLDQEEALAWMQRNGLNVEMFSSLIRDEVLIERYRRMARRLALLQVESASRLDAEGVIQGRPSPRDTPHDQDH